MKPDSRKKDILTTKGVKLDSWKKESEGNYTAQTALLVVHFKGRKTCIEKYEDSLLGGSIFRLEGLGVRFSFGFGDTLTRQDLSREPQVRHTCKIGA